jgi:hypothetical protein
VVQPFNKDTSPGKVAAYDVGQVRVRQCRVANHDNALKVFLGHEFIKVIQQGCFTISDWSLILNPCHFMASS